jgi:hypothetical protein
VRYPRLADTPRAGAIPTIAEIGQTEWPEMTAEIRRAAMDRAGVAKARLARSCFLHEYDNSYALGLGNAQADRLVFIVTLDPIGPAAPDKLSALLEQGPRASASCAAGYRAARWPSRKRMRSGNAAGH